MAPRTWCRFATVSPVEKAGWFEADDGLDEVQSAFVEVLRARAATWPLTPGDTMLFLPEYDAYGYSLSPGESTYGKLLVCVDIADDLEHVVLLTVGAYFDRESVRGDEVHNQLLTLPEQPTRLAMHATGSPEDLGNRTADWFETTLRLPALRCEWLRDGAVYAKRWLIGDPERGLADAQARVAALKVGSSPPDRIVHIRGDRQ